VRLQAPTAHQIGPRDVDHDGLISPAQFDACVRIEVQANRLDLSGAQLSEGARVEGTGSGGLITVKDVESALDRQ